VAVSIGPDAPLKLYNYFLLRILARRRFAGGQEVSSQDFGSYLLRYWSGVRKAEKHELLDGEILLQRMVSMSAEERRVLLGGHRIALFCIDVCFILGFLEIQIQMLSWLFSNSFVCVIQVRQSMICITLLFILSILVHGKQKNF
jgi:hypothetical protein